MEADGRIESATYIFNNLGEKRTIFLKFMGKKIGDVNNIFSLK